MATFAQIDSNSLVEKLILVSDQDSLTEKQGIDFCTATFGSGNYIQTFFDRKKRRRYARKGDYYDIPTDSFYDPDITQKNPTPSRWLNLPNGTSYCVTFRNASSTFTGIIAQTYFGKTTIGQSTTNLLGIGTTDTPTGVPYAIIRDPVDRFISSYALCTGNVPSWYPVSDFIDWLIQQDKTKLNPHFMPQVNLVGIPEPEGIQYFDFAKDLNPMAVALGLPTPLPTNNVTDTKKKPTLTPEQITTLQNFYSDDVELYAKVKSQP